ncbi:acyltransferase family protein [Brevibacillus massiliensis]|uniref:acyltransferase family protein n=1 Tax=Brevibacillus massiliensis TaxID=1118054 RepID=UPI0002EABFB6|nr:acyltransferase [Brevibacillus massiliensis]
MYTDKRLFSSLFLLQLFSSFLVLAGHYTADVSGYIQWSFWEDALNQISRYGTVLLTMITGFFTAHSLTGKKASGKKYFSGKFTYVYLPFLFSSILYFFVMQKGVPATLEDVKNIFFGNTAGHLYFIFMICQYYVFAFAFRRFITKNNIFLVCLLFFVLQYLFINVVAHGWMGLGIRHFLPTWIFTLYLGHLLYWYRQNIFLYMEKHRLVLFTLAGLALLGAIYFVLSPKLYTANHLVFVIASFLLLLSGAAILNRVVDYIHPPFKKGLTFHIYLLHPLFIIIGDKVVQSFYRLETVFFHRSLSVLYMFAIYIATYVVSLLCVKAMEKALGALRAGREQRRLLKQTSP